MTRESRRPVLLALIASALALGTALTPVAGVQAGPPGGSQAALRPAPRRS